MKGSVCEGGPGVAALKRRHVVGAGKQINNFASESTRTNYC